MTNLILMTKLIKVICIDNDGCSKNLKLNKIYDAEYIHEQRSWDWENGAPILEWHRYKLVDETGFTEKYNMDRFITLAEWREKQIDLILSDE